MCPCMRPRPILAQEDTLGPPQYQEGGGWCLIHPSEAAGDKLPSAERFSSTLAAEVRVGLNGLYMQRSH